MSKWVDLLAGGFVFAGLLFSSMVPLISDMPFLLVHVILWGLTIAIGYWWIKRLRTPSTEQPGPSPGPSAADDLSEGWSVQETRVAGIKKVVIGIAAFAVAAVVFAVLTVNNMTAYGIGWGVPGAIFLVGLIELVGGVPFTQLSSRWNSLKGWQRGVFGLLIVVFASLAIIGLLMGIATLTI